MCLTLHFPTAFNHFWQVRLVGGREEQEEDFVKPLVMLAEVEEGQEVEVLEEVGQWVAGEVLEVDGRLAMVEVEGSERRWVERAVEGLRVVVKDQGQRKRRRTMEVPEEAGEVEGNLRVKITFEEEEREVRQAQIRRKARVIVPPSDFGLTQLCPSEIWA